VALLQIEGVTVQFGGLTAVSDMDMSIEAGQIHALIGPNGAGKTTLFNVITRVIPPSAGSVHLQDKDLLHLQAHETVKVGITRTFQNLEIFRLMSVQDNLLVGYHSRIPTHFFSESLQNTFQKGEESKARQKALQVAGFLGMKNRLASFAGMLPYGLQKMVEVGRALMSDPVLLLLDEPAAGLNPSETDYLKEKIFEIQKMGITILLVEHDMSLVMDISNHITVMNFGKKIAEGSPELIRNHPDVIKAYLGESKYA